MSPPPRIAPLGTNAAADRRNVVGARLAAQGRTLEFDAGAHELRTGDHIVVDTRHGGQLVAVVSVASAPRPVRGPLARVIRRADARDLDRLAAQESQVAETLAYAKERARERNLPIKVFRVERPAGGDRMFVYFSSEQRIDFRDLVRDLAARFPGRIELRQVGVRDEAKMVGGIGTCGQELCCTTFLPSFAPVSIKMAKNQNLVLNPTKVTGQCGRLKCCLVYEEAQYVEAGKKLPKLGKRVDTPEGVGRVTDLDILAGKIRVSFPDKPPVTFTAADVRPAAPAVGGRELDTRGDGRLNSDRGRGGAEGASAPSPDGQSDSGDGLE